jgi:hypothetical protein
VGAESVPSAGAFGALCPVAEAGATGDGASDGGATRGGETGLVWPGDLLTDFGLAGLGAGGFFDLSAFAEAGAERGSRRVSAKAATAGI